MAQIPCPECKRQISETAESCPKCGHKMTAEAVTMAKKRQRDFLIACLVVCAIFVIIPILAIFTSSQQSTTSPTTQRQQTTIYRDDARSVNYYKNEYREARRAYETAKSNYNQNPSASNKRAWDDTTNKLDRAYLDLEKAMGAEPHKGVTKQRRELEAFTWSVKNERR